MLSKRGISLFYGLMTMKYREVGAAGEGAIESIGMGA
jgi:hypothetical protein